MNTKKRILALIPARQGSKRVPGKNIKKLDGKPLIAHTIETAIQSGCVDTVFVSTDCPEIAEVSRQYQASVPWLRAPSLATDTKDVIDTIIDVLTQLNNQKEHYDSIILLQPTSPFRTVKTIQDAIALHKSTGDCVVSVSKASMKPSWFRQITADGRLAIISNGAEAGEIFQLNGSIYISTTDNMIKNKSFYNPETRGFVIENEIETVDIDTPLDWSFAEFIAQSKHEQRQKPVVLESSQNVDTLV